MPKSPQIELSMHLPRRSMALRSLALASLCLAAGLPPALAAAPTTTAASAARLPAVPAQKKKAPAAPVKLIDLNSASRDELKKLPGVGDVEADKIIAARPLLTKAELVTRDILGAGPYLSLKHLVVALQKPPKPQQKSPTPAVQAAQPKPGGKGG